MPNTRISSINITTRTMEWPTWFLIVGVYGAWWLSLLFYSQTNALIAPLLVVVIALHTSVQHELLHGHPTRSVWFNSLLAYPSLSLLFPYMLYRESHIAHHNNQVLTLPGVDPESYYVSQKTWDNSSALKRAYYTTYKTVLGRLLFGPSSTFLSLLSQMMRDLINGTWKRKIMWLSHLVSVALILALIHYYFEIPVWHYLIIAYAANSLAMVRSFFEHRAVETSAHRSVIVEAGPFFRLLFLNNNYHYLHHKHPDLPWYELRTLYLHNREAALKENGHFLVKGYNKWLINHLFKPTDAPAHPFAGEK